MKPCRKYQKQIVWLAMDSLESRREPELRAHIDECGDCQKYFIEMRSIAGKLHAAEPERSVEPSSTFHRRVVNAVADTERHSPIESFFAELVSRWNWRPALPAVALAAVAVAAWVVAPQHSEVRNPSPVAITVRATPEIESDLAPTVSNYELVARQSLDKLDDLLTDQGSRNSSPTPGYTAEQYSRMIIVN